LPELWSMAFAECDPTDRRADVGGSKMHWLRDWCSRTRHMMPWPCMVTGERRCVRR
jgi:hypothetical protein